MNPYTGELHQLDSVAASTYAPGDAITSTNFFALPAAPLDQRELREAMREALDRAEQKTMVAVSSQVAQRVRLGERELRRRRQRR